MSGLPREWVGTFSRWLREQRLKVSNRRAVVVSARLGEKEMAKMPGKKEQYEVLYEEIKSQVKLVLEGHSTLDRKIGGVDAKIDRGTQEISQKLDLGFATVMKEIRELRERFDVHNHAHAR